LRGPAQQLAGPFGDVVLNDDEGRNPAVQFPVHAFLGRHSKESEADMTQMHAAASHGHNHRTLTRTFTFDQP
jgi:hypothetical protein